MIKYGKILQCVDIMLFYYKIVIEICGPATPANIITNAKMIIKDGEKYFGSRCNCVVLYALYANATMGSATFGLFD